MKSRKFFSKLKEESYDVSIFDLMNAKVYLEKDMTYLPQDYKKGYIEDFFTFFPEVLKEIKNKTEEEIEDFEIEDEEIKRADLRLCSMGSKQTGRESYEKLVKTVINYLIFINERPLHALTTRFPGGKQIIEKNGNYYCPIKNAQSNELSICEFCICKDLNEL
ncbi:uncharacterized protein (UPF0305 family) [Methanococcus maripaludis]|uniref:UPF0305 protein HNP86_001056 n=1 Tax=Methanococcus maripaludis TaxID=39152 RepID=A0A7J9NUF3_METMI|nr:DUF2115 domain-containing protein [Methanococcus maripaludis]MBA2850925.1 uncharacterized protein (UPF0305 family) [Methanococcus maripaludis]